MKYYVLILPHSSQSQLDALCERAQEVLTLVSAKTAHPLPDVFVFRSSLDLDPLSGRVREALGPVTPFLLMQAVGYRGGGSEWILEVDRIFDA